MGAAGILTTPVDRRFVLTTNQVPALPDKVIVTPLPQNGHCFALYNEFVMCTDYYGKGSALCGALFKHVNSMCPTEWVRCEWCIVGRLTANPGPDVGRAACQVWLLRHWHPGRHKLRALPWL
jgi:hypothetical protein